MCKVNTDKYPSTKMPGGPWNDATDRKLLLTIIHLSTPQLPKWDRVATLMGNGYTAESTRYVQMQYLPDIPRPSLSYCVACAHTKVRSVVWRD